MKKWLAATLLSLFVLGASAQANEVIWIEGQEPTSHTFNRHQWYCSDGVDRSGLSGGDWLTHYHESEPAQAHYFFQARRGGTYELWIRCNPHEIKHEVRLRDHPTRTLEPDAVRDRRPLLEDGESDIRQIGWFHVGDYDLSPGRYVLTIRVEAGPREAHGGIDAIALVNFPWEPEGVRRPEVEQPAVGPLPVRRLEEWYRSSRPPAQKPETVPKHWPFEPPHDTFDERSPIDLRHLNEEVAGQSGFLQRCPDGDGFVLGDGTPVRFWAALSHAWRPMPDTPHARQVSGFPQTDLERHGRFLAKRGVNMVRFFGQTGPAEGGPLDGINEENRDSLWRFVAAMKKSGIYVTYSPIWSHRHLRGLPTEEFGLLDSDGSVVSNLFFDTRLQEAYLNWMRELLTTPNPYTGIPLAEDPALAIIEVQNEDSLLFWSSQTITGNARTKLRRLFATWLEEEYGSLEGAREAWGPGHEVPTDQDDPDDFANGEAALFAVWEMTLAAGQSGGEARQRRLTDQLRFTSELMYDWNSRVRTFLKEELGAGQLINSGNWKTACNVLLNDAERWSYTANDIMGVNRYYSGIHQGDLRGWAIQAGDRFVDQSVLFRPRHLPVTLKQVEGFPMIIPESSWVPPLSYQSEGPLLIAAYSALTGVDIYYWFAATGEEDWRAPVSANYFRAETISKWSCSTAMLMGQWPAAALLYRRGFVEPGEPVVREHRPPEDIFSRRRPIIAEDTGYDPNRDTGDAAVMADLEDAVNPLAYLVGPVLVRYDGDRADSHVMDLDPFIDEERQVIRSNTGQLTWNYDEGWATVNAPRAQGVTGFLEQQGVFELDDVTIRSEDDYASVLIVPLDERPLSQSESVFVQVGTVERPTGWETRPTQVESGDTALDGEEILDVGRPPWQIRRSDLTIEIRNPHVDTAFVLDANGMPVGRFALETDGTRRSFRFPPDALYVVLQ